MFSIRRPDDHLLHLPGGHWLLVKKHLNAGEQRRIFARMIKGGSIAAGEKIDIDPEQLGITQITEYLLDWSVKDPDGKPVVILGKSSEAKAEALKLLDMEDFAAILEAVQAHDAAMTAEREAGKNAQATESMSLPTSPSPSSMEDGVTNG
jgi:hypothetical protein